MKIDSLADLIAGPGYAPKAWQSTRPDETWSHKPQVSRGEDLRRVLALPRRPPPDGPRSEALIELMTARYGITGPCRCAELKMPCISRLRIAQAWSLFELGLHGGLLGFIQVGAGKTLIDILAPLAIKGCKKALLLLPSTLTDQLVRHYQAHAGHFRVPSMIVHTRPEWRAVVPGAPVLHVYPYSRLSRPEATVFIEGLQPDTILADECHKLRHAGTATTGRVLRYFKKHPTTRFAGWSGSITDASIKDYAHLAALALRYASPLPIDPIIVTEWATAVDPSDFPAPPGALLDFCRPGEHVQSGFRRRLLDTAGVVSSTGVTVEAALDIRPRPIDAVPPEVEGALRKLRELWVRPDGEEMLDALEVNRCALQLAQGFFYWWDFPNGEPDELIDEWREARKEWRSDVRSKLRDRLEHFDSEDLAKRAAMRAWGDVAIHDKTLPLWKADTWPRWRDVAGLVKPVTRTHRLHPFLVEDAAAWADANRGVVWYRERAFGLWLSELSGLPLHAGGPGAGERLLQEKGDRSIVASIKSHGTGRDGMQYLFDRQLVGSPPASGSEWEQLLGRLHRTGQGSKVVSTEYYDHTEELRDNVDEAVRRAAYVEGTTPYGRQKLQAGRRGE